MDGGPREEGDEFVVERVPVCLFGEAGGGLLMLEEGREGGDDEFGHIAVLFAVLELLQQLEGGIEEEVALHHGRDGLVRFLEQASRGSAVRQHLEGPQQLLPDLLSGVLYVEGDFIELVLFNHGAGNMAWKVL